MPNQFGYFLCANKLAYDYLQFILLNEKYRVIRSSSVHKCRYVKSNTKIPEVNLLAFTYRLLHEDFSPISPICDIVTSQLQAFAVQIYSEITQIVECSMEKLIFLYYLKDLFHKDFPLICQNNLQVPTLYKYLPFTTPHPSLYAQNSEVNLSPLF